MASRSMDDLHPDLEALAYEFLADAEEAGQDMLITCTYRSNDEQNTLYAQGRTAPGHIVTNAKGGQSAHNHTTVDGKPMSRAFDVVPLRHGKCIWDSHDPAWQVLGKIGMALGLEWYGAPGSKFKEYPHFQLKDRS